MSLSSGALTLLSIKNGSFVLNVNLEMNVSPPNTTSSPDVVELIEDWYPVSTVVYVYICPHWFGTIFFNEA